LETERSLEIPKTLQICKVLGNIGCILYSGFVVGRDAVFFLVGGVSCLEGFGGIATERKRTPEGSDPERQRRGTP